MPRTVAAKSDAPAAKNERPSADRPESGPDGIVARLGSAEAFARTFQSVTASPEGRSPDGPCIGNAAPAAWSLVCAAAVRHLSRPGTRCWIVTPDVRTQERIHAELATWGLAAEFFPEQEANALLDTLPDPEIAAERLAVLHALHAADPALVPSPIVVTAEELESDVPGPDVFLNRRLDLRVGDAHEPGQLAARLEEAGFERVPLVSERGQFSLRGAILDVFAWQTPTPIRIEFFDRDIESIRAFDLDSQTSISRREECTLLLDRRDQDSRIVPLSAYAGVRDVLIVVNLPELPCHLRILHGSQHDDDDGDDPGTTCFESPIGGFAAGDFVLQEARREAFERQVAEWHAQGWRIAMFFNNEGELARFRELTAAAPVIAADLEIHVGELSHGFAVPAARLAVLADAEIFGRYQHLRARRQFNRERQHAARRAAASITDFTEGDLVVHADCGIARFLGIEHRTEISATGEDVIILEFAEKARLYVPLAQAHLVSRYVGAGRKAPELSRLGDGRWGKTRRAAERSILDYAAQLLAIQAERETLNGFAHPPDSKWQWEFENSFLYRETPDQLRAIEEAKRDMESPRPMDRLICGDVGFGKTEVAIRAAFKAVMSGKQVAVLVPTTVLAQQHHNTFRERMSDYPVTVELLSRFRTAAEQRKVVRGLADGSVDIVVGTHRLTSDDVAFKDLGLVVIDEEQRFGVKHKERFKDRFRLVDVLTLSATPIPRTLYLSLMGARDMSTIDTPPPNRIPVHTTICGYDERIIRDAVERELKRGGQVFLLHNRVRTIERTASRIRELCPDARVDIGHGQMDEHDLEAVMLRFLRGDTDVLVCTTIIETGVDIPNANTIIIDRADRFGLADLYQLRGRVGRSTQKAFAILLLPRDLMTGGDARKRVNAIKQYSSLGAGFKIAMRDLEIRGAGNLLGMQQSGHIAAVGFDLYCKMLRRSVGALSGESAAPRQDVALRIDFLCTSEAAFAKAGPDTIPAYLPATYMPDSSLRVAGYRQVAEIAGEDDLRSVLREWKDRFGPLPAAADNLLRCAALKAAASTAGISVVEIQGNRLMLTRNGDYLLVGGKFPRLPSADPAERLREAVAMVKSL